MYSLTQRQNYTFIILPVDEQEPVLSPTPLPSHTDFPSEDGNIFTDTKRIYTFTILPVDESYQQEPVLSPTPEPLESDSESPQLRRAKRRRIRGTGRQSQGSVPATQEESVAGRASPRGRGRRRGRVMTRARGRGRGGGRGRGRGEAQAGQGRSGNESGAIGDTSDTEWEVVDSTQDTPRGTFPFTATSGPRISLGPQATPYDYYTHFLGDDFLQMIVTGTNTYADHKIQKLRQTGRLSPGSRWHKWKPVSMEEMRAVMAIIINMGIMSIPDLEAYWKTSWECYIQFFHDVMGRNRFQEIFWNLHIPQPATSTLRVDKVSLLLDHIRSRSQAAFYPGREVSVDETMVGFRGRVSFKQYCPKKPIKYGLKFFVLADSSTGFVYNFVLYTGSEVTTRLPSAFSDLPVPGQFVMTLVEDLLDRGHIMYTDRYYSSIPLANALCRRNTGFVGTLVKNRKGLPEEVRWPSFKLASNAVKAWRKDRNLVVAWRHENKKPVVMLASVFSAAHTRALTGRRRQPITKPEVVVRYNNAMGGVDLADQYSVYYSFTRKSVKWSRKAMFWAMEVGMVNSYIWYKMAVSTPASHLQFRREVILSLCNTIPTGNVRRQLMRSLPREERFRGRHYLDQGPSRRRCQVCSIGSGERSTTLFFCKTCSNHPPLHPVTCFETYHEQR